MIKDIKYSFGISDYSGEPYINIKIEGMGEEKGSKDPYLLNTEINQLSGEYIKEIVQELEEVVAGKLNGASFGFETTNITVLKKGGKNFANGKIYPDGKVIIDYDYMEKELITNIPIEDILKMMKDWRDYIESWEKKTGKKYNGI